MLQFPDPRAAALQTNADGAIDKVNDNVARAGGELRCRPSRRTKEAAFARAYRSFPSTILCLMIDNNANRINLNA